MEFVQKAVFSNDKLSREILDVIGAVGKTSVAIAFTNSKNQTALRFIFTNIVTKEYIDVSDFESYSNPNRDSYMSMEKALNVLPFFEKTSTHYGSEANAKRKFFILLESLSHLEADIYLRLVSKKFDTESVLEYLIPEAVEKPVETMMKKHKKSRKKEADIENLNEINDLQDDDENVTD